MNRMCMVGFRQEHLLNGVPGAASHWKFISTIAAGIILAACGASSAGPSAAPTKESLVVGLAGFDTSFTQLYAAKVNGYFDQANLDVTITNFGANLIPGLVSGQADLVINGANSAMTPVKNGAQTTIVYNNAGGGISSFVYGLPRIKKISECTRMGSTQSPSSAYAWAVVEKKLFNGGWTLVPGANSTIVAELASGQIDCATGAPGGYSDLAIAGKAHQLLNPKDPSTYPTGVLASDFDFLESGVFGISSHVKERRDAITRFIKAFQRALPVVRTQTPAQLAAILKKSPDWAPVEAAKLEASIGLVQSFFAAHDGYIATSIWPGSIDFYIRAGSTFIDPTDPTWSYASRVDMSYYEKALGKPKSP